MAPTPKIAVTTLFKLWHSGVSSKKICEQLGISDSHLRRLVRKHGLPKRKNSRPQPVRMIDPSPAELARRAKEIRAGWSEREAARRYVGPKEQTTWTPPTFHFNAQTGTFRPE